MKQKKSLQLKDVIFKNFYKVLLKQRPERFHV